MGKRDDAVRVHARTRQEWREWLAAHHRVESGAWLVFWRKHTGKPTVSYEEAIEEALCFGWVDSTAGRLDDDRTMLWFAPRRRGSGWSRPNKQRVARLERAGVMAPAGLETLAAAKADGSWTRLDAVEDLTVPDDLAAALDALPHARRHFEAFPRSVRRGILEWIVTAKRPETRARRVAETARLADRDERANQWRPGRKPRHAARLSSAELPPAGALRHRAARGQTADPARALPEPCPATEIWGYNGMVLGPTLRQRRHGNKTVARNKNSLPEPYSTHLHGSPTQPRAWPSGTTWSSTSRHCGLATG